MKQIMTIDLEAGGQRRYAVYLHNMKYDGKQIHRDVSRNLLAHLVSSLKPDIVGIDNLSEYRKIFGILPKGTHLVEVCRTVSGTFRGITELAREAGIPVTDHPNPSVAARLLAVLILKGYGSVARWSDKKNKIVYHPLDWIDRSFQSHLKEATAKEFQRMTNKEVNNPSDLVNIFAEIGIIDEYYSIGKGKEAEIFLTSMEPFGRIAIKVFYKFSPSTKSFSTPSLSSNDWRKPSVLAAIESRHLRFLLKRGYNVPEVYHREGPMIFMEGIFNSDGSRAGTLSTTDLRKYKDPIIYFDELMDTLFQMFTEDLFVHGDFSPPNILIQDGEIRMIDVLQGRRWTHADPSEGLISYPDAIQILKSDVTSICKHFRQKYRLVIDVPSIIEEFQKASI